MRRQLLILILLVCAQLQLPASEVRVILWFDTEDYLLPADDDASKRLAEMLTQKGVRATFKIVGEKARMLEKRGRTDVIEALKKHDIGYHANFHSVHPTPSEYLAECGFLDGVAEFARREGPGAADVRRIFNVPTLSCYGQPGSSWGPQTLAGLKQIGCTPHGIPCYVDEGNHVGFRGIPFWYENALVVYDMADNWTRMELHDDSKVQSGKDAVAAAAQRLRDKTSPGLISIFYHPCEWVHQEFWDGVNFRRGANPPREAWKAPGQLSAEKTEAAFKRFSEYVDYIKSLPEIRFVTATDLPVLYPDEVRQKGATLSEVNNLVQAINQGGKIDAQTVGSKIFSPADQFEALVQVCESIVAEKAAPSTMAVRGVFGPDKAAGTVTNFASIPRLAFRDAVLDVADYLRQTGRIPARIHIGSDAITPLAFLTAMADAVSNWTNGNPIKPKANPELLTIKRIAEDRPNLFGGWIIHKEGFRAPGILEVARLQAWTLKPAATKQ